MVKGKLAIVLVSTIIVLVALTVGFFVHKESPFHLQTKALRAENIDAKKSIPSQTSVRQNSLAMTPWPTFQADSKRTGRSTTSARSNLRKKWVFQVNSMVESSVVIGMDGSLYFGAYDSNFYSVNTRGKLRWKFPTRGPVRSTAAISKDGSIYVTSRDGCLYALNEQGRAKWIRLLSDRSIDSSPALANDGTIFFGCHDGHLYAVTPDGQLKWVSQPLGHISASSPAISEDGTVYVGSYDGNLYALDTHNGAVEWKFQTSGGIRASPSINRGTIYVGSRDGSLYAVNRDGTLKWKFKTKGDIRATAAVSKKGTILFGSWDGDFYAVSPEGNLLWKFRPGKPIEASASVDDAGNVYFTSITGFLYVLTSQGRIKQKIGTNTFVHGTPIIDHDGSMYLTAGTRLIALGIPLPHLELCADKNQFSMQENIEAYVNICNQFGEEIPVTLKIWIVFMTANSSTTVGIEDKVISVRPGISSFRIHLNPFIKNGTQGLYKLRARILTTLTGEEIDYKEYRFCRHHENR